VAVRLLFIHKLNINANYDPRVTRRVVQLISREAQLMAATEATINEALTSKVGFTDLNNLFVIIHYIKSLFHFSGSETKQQEE
jgi:hypothetical protein